MNAHERAVKIERDRLVWGSGGAGENSRCNPCGSKSATRKDRAPGASDHLVPERTKAMV